MNDLKNIRQQPPTIQGFEVPEGKIRDDRSRESWEYKTGALTFNFANGKVLMNGQDMAVFITQNLAKLSTAYWTEISRKLEDYRRWLMTRVSDPEMLAIVGGLLFSLFGKLEKKLKKKFDEKQDGISFLVDEEGDFHLNGINVHAFIRMVKQNPNPKAQKFLESIKRRLDFMCENRLGNSSYERVRPILEKLRAAMQNLENIGVPGVLYLPERIS